MFAHPQRLCCLNSPLLHDKFAESKEESEIIAFLNDLVLDIAQQGYFVNGMFGEILQT